MASGPQAGEAAVRGARRGAPLGGLGAGGLTAYSDGSLGPLTIDGRSLAHPFWGVYILPGDAGARPRAHLLAAPGNELRHELGKTLPPLASVAASARFPALHYACNGILPINLWWTIVAPVLPYDLESARIGSLLLRAAIQNPTERPIEAAVMFGAFATDSGDGASPRLSWSRVERPDDAPAVEDPDEVKHRPCNCLLFCAKDFAAFCFNGVDKPPFSCSMAAWEGFPEALQVLRRFAEAGVLNAGGQDAGRPESGSGGAACLRGELAPKSWEAVDFVLSWRKAPESQTEQAAADMGRLCLQTTRRTIRYRSYYARSAKAWHARLAESALPSWLTSALANSIQSLVRHVEADKESRLVLNDWPSRDPLERLWRSMGTSVLFPRLEEEEFDRALGAAAEENGRCSVRTFCCLALGLYRNFLLTAKRPEAKRLFPQLLDLAAEDLQENDPVSGPLADIAADALFDLQERLGKSELAAATEHAASRLFGARRRASSAAVDAAAGWLGDFLRLRPASAPTAAYSGKASDIADFLGRICLDIRAGRATQAFERLRGALASADLRDPQWLALWNVPYAMTGLLYDAPNEELWLRPKTPGMQGAWMLPLATPQGLGQCRRLPHDNRLIYEISFDSPVQLRSLILLVDELTEPSEATCEGPDGSEDPAVAFGDDGDEKLVEIVFGRRISLTSPLRVEVF